MGNAGSRRSVAVAVAVVGFVAAASGAFLLLRPTLPGSAARAASATATATPAAVTPAPVLTGQEAAALEGALGSGSPTELAHAVVLGSSQSIDPGAAPKLATLGVRIEPTSFQATSPTSATVRATTQRPAGTWTLLLARQDGKWKIVATAQGAS